MITVSKSHIPIFVLANAYNKKNNREKVTPHKIAVAIFIREFTAMKIKDPDGLAFGLRAKHKKDFCMLVLKLVQSPDLDLSELQAMLHSDQYNLLATQVRTFESKLVELDKGGVVAMLDLFSNIKNHLKEPLPLNPAVTKTSIIGMFLRRIYVFFEKQTFSEVVALCEAFRKYLKDWDARCTCTKTSVTGDDSLESSNDMELTIGEEIKHPLTESPASSRVKGGGEESHSKCTEKMFWSKKQAELFVSQQAALIQNNEPAAMPPPELHEKLRSVLQANSENASAHFLSYLNCLRVKEYSGAIDSLYHSWDRNTYLLDVNRSPAATNEDKCRSFRYASLNVAILHVLFGHNWIHQISAHSPEHWKQAIRSLKEAIMMAHEGNDNHCLQHALAWLYKLSIENKEILMERSISKSTELSLSYLASLGIQSMAQHAAAMRGPPALVFEDERRVEQNSRHLTELESVHNNVRLLSEMLDSYRVGQSSTEELDLIKELHQSCERLRPNVFRLASETQESEALLNEVLNVSDELGQVFDKYTAVIVHGKTLDPVFEPETGQSATSLLDLSTPSEERLPPVPTTLLNDQLADLGLSDKQSFSQPPASMPASKQSSNFEALGDIFQSITPTISPGNAFPLGGPTILQPVSLTQAASNGVTSPASSEVQVKPDKLKAFKDLDALGESMLKQNLPTSCKLGSQFAKPPSKVPMNLLSRLPEPAPEPSKVVNSGPSSLSAGSSGTPAPTSDLYLDFLVGGPTKTEGGGGSSSGGSDLLNGDDSMVDLSEDVPEEPSANKTLIKDEQANVSRTPVTKDVVDTNVNSSGNNTVPPSPAKKLEVKPLADIFVHLESIKPGNIPPLTVLDEKNGISVVLHFAKERPRQDVSVIVVTTLSKNTSPLTNYLFQAVVPKTCKLRLQPPSGCDLPAYNPFLPPAAITQVLLIANPNKDPVSLKFMVSYLMEDETVTEMGEVEKLPLES